MAVYSRQLHKWFKSPSSMGRAHEAVNVYRHSNNFHSKPHGYVETDRAKLRAMQLEAERNSPKQTAAQEAEASAYYARMRARNG